MLYFCLPLRRRRPCSLEERFPLRPVQLPGVFVRVPPYSRDHYVCPEAGDRFRNDGSQEQPQAFGVESIKVDLPGDDDEQDGQ